MDQIVAFGEDHFQNNANNSGACMRLCALITLSFVFFLSCSSTERKRGLGQETKPTNAEVYLDEESALREGRQIELSQGRKSISREQAIEAVTAYRAKTHKSVGSLIPNICEQVRSWRIIYEDSGFEYVVDKYSPRVLIERKLPLELINGKIGVVPSSPDIGKKDAIEIARRDFAELLKSYGNSSDHINEYTPFACELERAWRVVFEYRQQPSQKITELPNTNPPLYLIDKNGGRIVAREPPMKASDR